MVSVLQADPPQRREREERKLREILKGQRRRTEAQLHEHESGGIHLTVEFSEEDMRQRQADTTSWSTHLAQLDRDLDTESACIREFYEV